MEMQRGRKRKSLQEGRQIQPTSSSPSPSPSSTVEPYPSHQRPTREECLAVRNDLLALHGFPEEFAKFRRQRRRLGLVFSDPNEDGLVEEEEVKTQRSGPKEGDDSDGKEELSVLDGLVSTVLSQNTSEANSTRAFASLKSAFPSWEDVLSADQKSIENAIRCGGLAPTKASCIKNLLTCLMERKGKLCLEYLRDLSIEEIKGELSSFKGIGPKTVACVLMFNLHQDEFPVDTHIFQISRTLGWVPASADVKRTYIHLNQRIPDNLKFDLNCLLYTHGKLCSSCSIRKGKQEKRESTAKKPCLLLKYSDDTLRC